MKIESTSALGFNRESENNCEINKKKERKEKKKFKVKIDTDNTSSITRDCI